MNPHYGCSLKNPALHVRLPVLSSRYWVPLQGQSLPEEVISFVVTGQDILKAVQVLLGNEV